MPRHVVLSVASKTEYISRLIKEIYSGRVGEDQLPVEARTDSKTLVDSISSTKQVDEKTIRHIVAWIKQQKETNVVSNIVWVNSHNQLAVYKKEC